MMMLDLSARNVAAALRGVAIGNSYADLSMQVHARWTLAIVVCAQVLGSLLLCPTEVAAHGLGCEGFQIRLTVRLAAGWASHPAPPA